MQRKNPRFFILTFLTFSLILIAMLSALNLKPYYIENTANLAYYDCIVYEDIDKTVEVVSIEWGVLTPSENKTLIYYVENQRTTNAVLTSSYEGFLPIEAGNFIVFETTPQNFMFNPQEIKPVNFTIRISPNILNITAFSFDVILYMS